MAGHDHYDRKLSHHKKKVDMDIKLEVLNTGTIAISGKMTARSPSTIYLKREQLPELAKLVLRELVPELKTTEPLVLYFGNEADRKEMADVFKQLMQDRGAKAVEV